MTKFTLKSFSADPRQEIEDYLFEHYDIHFNILTEQAELRRQDSQEPYQVCGKRMVNSLLMEVRAQGIKCVKGDIQCLLHSDHIRDFHPMKSYVENLPEWDGVDRITPLAERISHLPLWVNGFHRWMLALTAQWMGRGEQCANALAPILVSETQGWGKSTFCRMLLPQSLQPYYIDSMDISTRSHIEQRLGTMALINLDEFDRLSSQKMAWLKNVMQMKTCSYRRLYTNEFRTMDRMASFIGTSNSHHLLDDPSGSRRFLCVDVEGPISREPIELEQIFAQLRYEVLAGERCYLTREEEAEVELHNQAFYRPKPEEEVFHRFFEIPESGEDGIELSATDIYNRLQSRCPAAMRDCRPQNFAASLVHMGVRRVHRAYGNNYLVRPRIA